jgi:hypothetical protein
VVGHLLVVRPEAFMHRHAQALVLVVGALLASSCSNTDARSVPAQPSFISASFATITTTSSTVTAQPVSNPSCPSITPFKVDGGIVVTPNGSSNVNIDDVRFRFTDTSGLQTPQITLPMLPVTIAAPNPVPPVGSATAGSSTTLPLTFGIGCGTGKQGTITLIVDMSDDRGRRGSQQLTMNVR